MKRIELLDAGVKLRKTDLRELYAYLHNNQINSQVFWAYFEGLVRDYEMPDFGCGNTLWEKDYEDILETMERLGIEEFTISHTASGTINDCMWFVKNGYHLAGMTELLTGDRNLFTGEPEKKPAFVFKKGGIK